MSDRRPLTHPSPWIPGENHLGPAEDCHRCSDSDLRWAFREAELLAESERVEPRNHFTVRGMLWAVGAGLVLWLIAWTVYHAIGA